MTLLVTGKNHKGSKNKSIDIQTLIILSNVDVPELITELVSLKVVSGSIIFISLGIILMQ